MTTTAPAGIFDTLTPDERAALHRQLITACDQTMGALRTLRHMAYDEPANGKLTAAYFALGNVSVEQGDLLADLAAVRS